MARTVEDILREVRALSREEKVDLLRRLVAELDATAGPEARGSWITTAQRRYRELVDGTVEGVPGPLVFQRLRTRLGG